MSPLRFRSFILWPSGAVSPRHGITADLHDTERQAHAICDLLRSDGLRGERIHFPLRTWVAPAIESLD